MAERKEMVLAWLKKNLLGKSNLFLGIDIGSSSVKLVELAFDKDLYVLKNVGIASLAADEFEEEQEPLATVEKALRQLIDVQGIKAREAILSIGGRDFFAREVQFPKMEPAELAEAVKWDIEKYVPYEEGNYYYDFDVLPAAVGDEEVRVILVAAPKQAVDDLVAIVKRLGIHPLAIEGESFALARTLGSEENYILVDIGKENSKIVIFQDQVPIATRNVPVYGDSFTEAIQSVMDLQPEQAEALKQRQGLYPGEAVADENDHQHSEIRQRMEGLAAELASEITRTMEYYRVQNKNAVIDRIYISGGGARMTSLVDYIAKSFSIPVLCHQPLANITCGASFDPVYLETIAPQVAVAAGLAMRGDEI